VFKEAALDPEHRVAANALVGLHFNPQTDIDVTGVLQGMTRKPDPVARSSAAFAMGRTNDASYVPLLECLLRDGDASVRGQALQALIRIRRHGAVECAEQTPAAPTGEVAAPAEVAPPPEVAPVEEAKPEPVSS
jgi:HEAT repeat protein